ncbi:MAG: hypothetical protein GY696_05625, partial [Gammaproteobacteria bacterium]|nr:hypothetical protein [Gammaproteobacteria bacterium]
AWGSRVFHNMGRHACFIFLLLLLFFLLFAVSGELSTEWIELKFSPGREVFVTLREQQRQRTGDEDGLEEDPRPRMKKEMAECIDRMESAPDSLLPQLKNKLKEMRGLLNLVEAPMFPAAVTRDTLQAQRMEKQVLQFPRKRKKKSVLPLVGTVDLFEEMDASSGTEETPTTAEWSGTALMEFAEPRCSWADCTILKQYDSRLDWKQCKSAGLRITPFV